MRPNISLDGDEITTFLEASFIGLHMEDDEYIKKSPEGRYSSNGYADEMAQYLVFELAREDTRTDRSFTVLGKENVNSQLLRSIRK